MHVSPKKTGRGRTGCRENCVGLFNFAREKIRESRERSRDFVSWEKVPAAINGDIEFIHGGIRWRQRPSLRSIVRKGIQAFRFAQAGADAESGLQGFQGRF